MHRGLSIALALAMLAAPARAEKREEQRDADEPISIEQIVTIAVRRSPDLGIVRNDARRAALGESIADAPNQWRLDGGVTGETRRDSSKITGRVGIAKLLPTGGDLGVVLSTTQERLAPQPGQVQQPTAVTPPTVTALAVDLRQPLLRGVGDNPRVETKKAAIGADAATLTAQDTTASTLRDLVEAYWELAFARASLDVRKQSLQLAESQLDLSRKMHARGAIPESAVVAARYGVALRQEAKLRAADAVQSASLRLRRLAGLEIAVELGDLAPTDALVIPRRTPDVETVVATAIAKSPRIAAAKLGIAIADLELDARKNRALPAIDLGATAVVAGGTDALLGGGGTKEYQLIGRLEMRYEIGGANRAAADAARLDRASAKLSAKDVERETVALVIDISRRVRAAQARAEVAKAAIDLAKSNLDTELALFRADKSSNVLVFERQTELDEARLLASRAAADCQIALATLDYLTGSLLDRHGVEALPTPGARHAK